MNVAVALPAVTSLLAFVFAIALIDQWRERRQPFQAIWTVGMVLYGLAAAFEAIGEAAGWSDTLFRGWFAAGIATPAWLGLGTAFLLSRTRFGYTYGFLVAVGALLSFVARSRYPDAGSVPALVLLLGLGLALAIALETYFQNARWSSIAAIGVIAASVAALLVIVVTPLRGVVASGPLTINVVAAVMPGPARILALPLTLVGGLALLLGALFSVYVFMPKRRVLPYSLDPNQTGDQFLFNLLIAPVAILVNLVASLPGALHALATGRIHSRVPATILIAIGALVPSVTDSLDQWASLGRLVGVVFLFAGFLVSVEVFREIRIPFTSVRLRTARNDGRDGAGSDAPSREQDVAADNA